MTKTYYVSRAELYRYNSGSMDNGCFTEEWEFDKVSEALDHQRSLDSSIAASLYQAGGLLNRKLGVFRVTITEEAML